MANLLPNNIQKRVFRRMLARNVGAAAVVFSFFALIGIGSLLPVYVTWQARAEALSYAVASLHNVPGYEQKTLRSDVSVVNKRLAIIGEIMKSGARPSDVIRDVIEARPSSVSIERFEYSVSSGDGSGKLTVSGIVPKESEQNSFIATLRANPMFEQVNIPISALVRTDSRAVTLELLGAF